MKVIQLDGEVDPGQMELLSAVLNNDGAVVLGNNERIIIPETVRFIWEVREKERKEMSVPLFCLVYNSTLVKTKHEKLILNVYEVGH